MVVIIYIVSIGVYFIPTIIASGKTNSTSIFLLNLLLGWTFVAWVGALIWAVMDKDVK